jgi:O-antigen/teichoic acid export membrane protein
LGVNFLSSDFSKWILATFSNPLQLAIYGLTTQILRKILDFYPLRMFKPLAEPAMYGKYDEKKEGAALNKMFQFFYNANNIFGFMVLAIFLPLGRDLLLTFFKREYTADTYYPLIIFMFFVVFYSIPLGIVAKAIEKPKILLWAKLSVIGNIGIGIPLAAFFGAVGMAVAAAFSVMLKNAIIYILAKKHVELQIPWMSTVKSLLNTLITAAVIYGLKLSGVFDYFIGTVNLGLFVLAGIGVIVYMGVSKFNSIFSISEKELLFSLMPKKAKNLANKIL